MGSNIYLEGRTIYRNCYFKKRRKINKNDTLLQNQQPKIDKIIHKKPIRKFSFENKLENKTCHRLLKVVGSGFGEIYVMNYILLQKQDPIFLITKSQNQYPNIKAQTSDETQPLENYENSIVVFDDMLLSNQESNIDIFYSGGGRHKKMIITMYLKTIFISLKKLFVINPIYLFHLNKL